MIIGLVFFFFAFRQTAGLRPCCVLTDKKTRMGACGSGKGKPFCGRRRKRFSSSFVFEEGFGGIRGTLGGEFWIWCFRQWVVTHGRGRGRENKICICAVALIVQHSSSCLALGLSCFI